MPAWELFTIGQVLHGKLGVWHGSTQEEHHGRTLSHALCILHVNRPAKFEIYFMMFMDYVPHYTMAYIYIYIQYPVLLYIYIPGKPFGWWSLSMYNMSSHGDHWMINIVPADHAHSKIFWQQPLLIYRVYIIFHLPPLLPCPRGFCTATRVVTSI